MTSDAERAALLKLARDAMTAHVTSGVGPVAASTPVEDARKAGAFVTLHIRGHLRGCIGHVEADRVLAEIVADCAVAACSADPRFPPVTAAELCQVAIELSILGPLEPISSIDEIEIGRHGLVVELGWRRGLLLPQVATEWHWDRRTFIEQTCHKAGLAHDAWKNGAKIWTFEAEVFGEMLNT